MAEPRGRLLVIDDEEDLLQMLALMLTMEGFEITTVASGGEALRHVSEGKFDVVVTDLRMPGMDGYQTLLAIKRIDPNVRVIVTTGYATRETRGKCADFGAFDLVCKPFEVAELVLVLNRALEPGGAVAPATP